MPAEEQRGHPLKKFAKAVLVLGLLGLVSFPCVADQLATCTPDLSTCFIPENVVIDLPFVTFAGDVIVVEPDLTTISDVFRIFNNLLDTGGGTGLGDVAFLYSSDDSTPLPDPSTFSANAVAAIEGPGGVTVFSGSGSGVTYLLNTPEPASFLLLALALVPIGWLVRRRRVPSC